MSRVVVIQMMNQYADLLSAMADELRERHSYECILLHYGPNGLPSEQHYNFRRASFKALIDIEPHIMPRADIAPTATLAGRVHELEHRLGFKLLESIRSDRHLGYGFVVGAEYPRSRYGVATSFDQSLDIAVRLTEAIESALDAHGVDVVVGSPSNIAGSILIGVAQGTGRTTRIPALSISGRIYWAERRDYWPPGIRERYATTLAATSPAPSDDEPTVPPPPERAASYIRGLRRETTISTLARRLYSRTRTTVGFALKRRDAVYGRYLYLETIKSITKVWRLRRKAFATAPLGPKLPDGLPFVLYPLTIEPEATLMTESPTCDDQLGLIDQVAKSMPTGWRLVVKEHPGFTSPRPRGFWERIRRYPNVLVASPLESGEALLLRARALVVIRSTLGLQAAAAGIPVITPHPSYIGSLLPHVFNPQSYAEMEQTFRRIAGSELPPLRERRRCARALLAAMDAGGVALKDKNLIRGVAGGTPIPKSEVDSIVSALIDGLASNAAAPALS